jgi:hypothetical protein
LKRALRGWSKLEALINCGNANLMLRVSSEIFHGALVLFYRFSGFLFSFS